MNGKSELGFLFDLDGVIIDSEKEYSEIWRQINKEYPTGIDNFEEKIKGTTLHNILNEHYPDPEVQAKVKNLLYELESRMKYEFKEGSEELLHEINNREYPLALVTSSDRVKMKHLDDELPGLIDFFDQVITGDMVKCSKPDPEGYLLAAEILKVKPEKCVVFEDSLQGVKAGKNAGAFVVGIAGTLKGFVLQPFVDKVIDSLIDFDLDGLIQILTNNEQ